MHDVRSGGRCLWRFCGWGVDVDAEHLSGAVGDERIDVVEAAPVLADDEQGAPVRAAERQGEGGSVEFDAVEDLAAFTDANRGATGVGVAAGHGAHVGGTGPDGAFGIDADAVWADTFGPDPPVSERSVRFDVEGGEPSGDGLGHDQG